MITQTSSPVQSRFDRLKERLLFLLLLLIQAAIFGRAFIEREIPRGADGLQYLTYQYYVLNNIVTAGEIPQWIPFMTHGMIGNLYYSFQAGLVQNVLLLLGPLLKGLPFLAFFQLGMFADELVLIAGSWMLARRYMKTPEARFFTTLSITAGSLWSDSIWFGLHFFYLIPLILYFFHRFIETGKVRYLAAVGTLNVFQAMSNAIYVLPVQSLAVFLYIVLYLITHPRQAVQRWKELRPTPALAASLALVLISLGALYVTVKLGYSEVVAQYSGRQTDGNVDLQGFLAYGGAPSLTAWVKNVLGLSPYIYFLFYTGVITIPFFLFGFAEAFRRPESRHLPLTFLFLALFSWGTWVSVFFYYLWPMMKMYRHLFATFCFAKLFIFFTAGVGFEKLISEPLKENKRKLACFMIAALMAAAAAVLLYLNRNGDLAQSLVYAPWSDMRQFLHVSDFQYAVMRIQRAAFFFFIGAVLFTLRPFLKLRQSLLVWTVLVLALQTADIYGYKLEERHQKMRPLTKEQSEVFSFQSTPYTARRSELFWTDGPQSRAALLFPFSYERNERVLHDSGIPPEKKIRMLLTPPMVQDGGEWWTYYAFLFKDQLHSSFRTDQWLRPLNKLLRTYWNQPLTEEAQPLGGIANVPGMLFPTFLSEPPVSLRKITGTSEDKIQFFSEAYQLESEEAVSRLIRNPHYEGDTLLLSPGTPESQGSPKPRAWQESQVPGSDRLRLPYGITRFDANHLVVSVTIPEGDPVWLYYADVWHPYWQVFVDGKRASLFRANLAYKAVPLPPGSHVIHFRYDTPGLAVVQIFWAWISALILLITFNLAFEVMRDPALSHEDT